MASFKPKPVLASNLDLSMRVMASGEAKMLSVLRVARTEKGVSLATLSRLAESPGADWANAGAAATLSAAAESTKRANIRGGVKGASMLLTVP
jgi:hypothetical protein